MRIVHDDKTIKTDIWEQFMFKLLLPSHFVMIVTYFLLGTKDEQSDIGNPIPTPRIIKRVPLISRWTFHFPQGTPLLYLPQPRTHHGNCPTFHNWFFYQFYFAPSYASKRSLIWLLNDSLIVPLILYWKPISCCTLVKTNIFSFYLFFNN